MANKFELQNDLEKIREEIARNQKLNEELKLTTNKLREQYSSKKTLEGSPLGEETLEKMNNQIITNGGKSGEFLLAISQLEERAAKNLKELAKFVEPTCSKCGEMGNIFEYRGVPAQSPTIGDVEINDDDLPKNKIFIVYCTKCGNIVGTTGKV
ncbi:MAG: hypothetical protein GPJ54_07490 [Candidatus Heimdallarchaeota archaeon]|nr:hypothetical protein [Candidatus Heimdallarchaeota archaeon]